MPEKMARSAPRPPFGGPALRQSSAPPCGLVRTWQKRKNPPRFGAHLENPGSYMWIVILCGGPATLTREARR
jgi:hypothetical protein